MAEEAGGAPQAAPSGPLQNRQLIIIFAVVAVVIFILLLVGMRACSSRSSGPKYTVIYSNLELKDTAEVITILKELGISYKIRDKGTAIAVPTKKADDARIGLAEENLPKGSSVGWEIFDAAKLGATDFDRRIQFIRAVSGELSRTINRIVAIDDSKVQIVIPETKMFETVKSPVTASVLLKIKKGYNITSQQINGILHLVSSSVENLQKENITIIDVYGKILSSGGVPTLRMAEDDEEMEDTEKKTEKAMEKQKQSTEEKMLTEVKARKELEDQLTAKVQSLISRMYPPNTVVARVNMVSMKTKKKTVIMLIDENAKIDASLKRNTFETIAAAIDYKSSRGDKIIMKRVPFKHIVPLSEIGGKTIIKEEKTVEKKIPSTTKTSLIRRIFRSTILRVIVGVLMVITFLLFVVKPMVTKKKELPEKVEEGDETKAEAEEAAEKPESEKKESEKEKITLESIQTQVKEDPRKAAQLIISWVRGEIE